jgi:hypothetical protein
VCKHCRVRINHHRKSEQASSHLNNCSVFKKLVHRMEIDARPEWYIGQRKQGSPSILSKLAMKSSTDGSESSVRSFLLPAVDAGTRHFKQQWPSITTAVELPPSGSRSSTWWMQSACVNSVGLEDRRGCDECKELLEREQWLAL